MHTWLLGSGIHIVWSGGTVRSGLAAAAALQLAGRGGTAFARTTLE
jgi:hypothetical protein